jgi:curved DNA-binding protein CbpA
MFYKDAESAYKILEVEPTATDDELKKAKDFFNTLI